MAFKGIDLTGQRFGKLTVIERLFEHNDYKSSIWLCKCDCGGQARVFSNNLRRKLKPTNSCGCIHKATVTKHGLRYLPEYRVWVDMITRCYNNNHKHYGRYGGRGIIVSDEWKESFEAFYRDMGPRPSKDHSIDRQDNDKGYSKDNCHWATWEEQARNRSNSFYCEYKGQIKLLVDWCIELDLHYNKTYCRLINGWTLEEAFAKVKRKYVRRK